MFTQFYKKNILERLTILKKVSHMTDEDITFLHHGNSLSLEHANTMCENVVGLYSLPFGLAPNFLINGKSYHAPMVTEEPSVIAAASLGAKLIGGNGGFLTLGTSKQIMIGEIVLHHIADPQTAKKYILNHTEAILKIANDSYPSIYNRGGGAKNITVEIKHSEDAKETFVIVYLEVDTKEAMGANIVNTMLEHVSLYLPSITPCSILMSILSNYNPYALFKVKCELTIDSLQTNEFSGEHVRDKIISAYTLATVDKFRCVTHNKGVMNGVNAVVLASGNDTRAVEAAIHSYSHRNNTYYPLTKWYKHEENGNLIGEIELPLKIGYVGGGISAHPSAQIAQRLSNTTNVTELSYLIAAVGLAQNFAALRALVTTGIQKGHMALQLKSLLLSLGASTQEIDTLLSYPIEHKNINQEKATILLDNLRKNAHKDHSIQL